MARPHIHIDEARLLPRYRQPGTNTPATTSSHGTTSTLGSTTHTGTTATAGELRGIPVQARGVGGVIPHTNPEAETIHRLSKREQAA